GDAPPVDRHADLQRGMAQDGGRPVHRVNLGHQRGVDQAGDAVQVVVAPIRVFALQAVANGVVLQGEQVVEDAQPHPPNDAQAGLLNAGAVDFHHAVLDTDLAAVAGPEAVGGGLAAAVNFRAVPPVGLGVGIGRLFAVGWAFGRVALVGIGARRIGPT